jgi:acyloxyacyl hydrolase
MTTPEQFYKNIYDSALYYDRVLPPGSHVAFIGIVDGRILFNSLSELIHPLGPKYRHMYDYLNCLQINPCYMWMNSNSTLRDMGSERAKLLNSMYTRLMTQHQFRNFKMSYQEFPLSELLERAQREGVHPSRLIEPFDGFHPRYLFFLFIVNLVKIGLLKLFGKKFKVLILRLWVKLIQIIIKLKKFLVIKVDINIHF